MTQLQGAIAAIRFGMGARPGEIAAASSDARGWLKAQIKASAASIPDDGLLSTKQVYEARQEIQMENGMAGPPGAPGAQKGKPQKADMVLAPGVMPPGAAPGQPGDAKEMQRTVNQMIQRESREGLQKEVAVRGRHAASTDTPFAERWARFWANHFTVAARNAQIIGLVGPFEREAIRPNVFANFGTLLGASSFHPGMLVYLDAARSIGPSTEAAKRRDAGLNENLAREIMELHTLGVGSGYTQADIIEFAKALTGWTLGGPQTARLAGIRPNAADGKRQQRALREVAQEMRDEAGEAVFVEQLHEPGSRTVLGKTYAGAKGQASAILDDLVMSPATARHIATKLARHFVADHPPESAIKKIEATWMKSQADLSVIARAVVDMDEAWADQPVKFKQPEELLISVARATGVDSAFGKDQRAVYQSLAQQPFSAPSPAGWPDDTASWSGADAIKKRLEWANSVSRRMSRAMTPNEFLDRALGPIAGAKTRQAVSRAESAEQGFTLALMSPEFQRR
ncbi:MAG TPA: DUF1800 family protein [Hyphomonadaceae bacterium]|jgi:uncharacterized protein (DUF1800 family)|nr:DUF1800 family protein [Hyphomonadaceae bacterium]